MFNGLKQIFFLISNDFVGWLGLARSFSGGVSHWDETRREKELASSKGLTALYAQEGSLSWLEVVAGFSRWQLGFQSEPPKKKRSKRYREKP